MPTYRVPKYDAVLLKGNNLSDILDAALARANISAVGLTGNETIAGNKTFTGSIHVDGGAGTGTIIIDADSGFAKNLYFRTDNVNRWDIRVDSGVSDNFHLRRYNDAGTFLDNIVDINRSTGEFTLGQSLTVTGAIKVNGLSATSRAIDASTLVCTDVASAATLDVRLTARATVNGAYTNRAADLVLSPEIASGVTNTSACGGLVLNTYRNINAGNTDQGTLTAFRGVSVVGGHFNTVGGNSPTTTNFDAFVAFPTCRSGTIGTLRGFHIDPLSGSGGTVTTLTGFSAGALVGGTTTHGFRGQVAAAAGRWNVFMDGTALNHMQGALLIGTTTDDGISKLQIAGDASVASALRVVSVTAATNPIIRGINTGYASTNFSAVGAAWETGTTYSVGHGSTTAGGMVMSSYGNSTAAGLIPMVFNSHNGTTAPTGYHYSFRAWKHDGTTGRTAIGTGELHSEWLAGSTVSLMTLSGVGNLTVNGTGHQFGANTNAGTIIGLNSAAGNNRQFQFRSANVLRWNLLATSATESGSDAGTAFSIAAYNDAGTFIDNVITSLRASGGAITIGGSTLRPTTFTGAVLVNGSTTLGDASDDALTINAGVWTLGSNYIANRAMGTLASGSTVAQQFNVSASGNADGTSNPLAHALTLTISGANNLNLPRVYNGSFVNTSTGTVTQVRGYAMNIAQSSVGGTLTESRGASISTQVNNTGGIGTAYDYLAEAPLMSSTGTIGTHIGFSSQNLGHANINTAIGFSASDITASVTMMGFRGLLTSGTGKWNLFMSGTAANHLQGDTLIGTSSGDGVNKLQVAGSVTVSTGNAYKVNNVQVVAARKTGWSTATGTATRTTFDTTTVTTTQLAERVKALIDDLHNTAGHGLIGT